MLLLRRGARLGIVSSSAAALILGALFSGSVSCGASNAFSPGEDGGNNGPDGGPPLDGSPDAFGPRTFRAIAVNASPDLPAVRFCMSVGGKFVPARSLPIPSDATHPMPESNFPGVPIGAGIALPSIALPDGPITLHAIVASRLYGNADYCAHLICTDTSTCLHGYEYFTLPPLDTSTFTDGKTALVAITGSASAGTLATQTFALDPIRRADQGSMGVQIAQLSPSLAAGATIWYGPFDNSGPTSLLANGPPYGTLAPQSAQAVPLPTSERELALKGLVVNGQTVSGVNVHATFPLGGIPPLTDPSALATTYFKAQTNYVFAIIGDPTLPSTDAHGLRVVAFPTTIAADVGL